MRPSIRFHLAAGCVLLALSVPAPAAGPMPKLERIAMLMRHGIRPPTSLQPIPAKYSPKAWPKWSVGPGLLTGHGAKGIGLLAQSDRAYLVGAGLLPVSGCPSPGQISVYSSNITRAVETAQAWVGSFVPGCTIEVRHPASGAPDPLFHIIEGKPSWFDGHQAFEAALAQSPRGGLAAQAHELEPEMRRLQSVLGCTLPECNLEKDQTRLVERPHGRPDFNGPLDVASTASESFLLEYLENKPASEVGWGRLNRDEIERLLVFNSIKFKYVDRPLFIARAAAGPLASVILKALTEPSGPRITLLSGHDTNIADLGGLLNLHWRVTGYPADAIPPGSALGFELFSSPSGREFVRAFYRAQRMEQLRHLEQLGPKNQPFRTYLRIPGCGRPDDAQSCSLQSFTKLIEARLR